MHINTHWLVDFTDLGCKQWFWQIHTGDSAEEQGLTLCHEFGASDYNFCWSYECQQDSDLFSCWSQNPWRTVNWSLHQMLLTGQQRLSFVAACSATPAGGVSGQERCPAATPPTGLTASRRTGRELEAGISSVMPAWIGRAWDSKHVVTWAGLILRAGIAPLIQCIQSNWIMKQK